MSNNNIKINKKVIEEKIKLMEFAEQKLYKMGGYRNRLTHFYFEVKPEEMHSIVQNNLNDFKEFMGYIKPLLAG